MSNSHVKVQDSPCSPEQFSEGLEKLHEILREPGITTAMVIVTDGNNRVITGCVGSPLDIITGAVNGATQICNVARKNVTINEG